MLGIPKNDEPKFVDKKSIIDPKILSLIDEYDVKFIDYLKKLYMYLGGEYIDIENVENIVSLLSKLNEKKQYSYLENLLHPERNKGVKIPSPIPVPSCSFQLHNCVTLSTNASGNLAFVFNPFFLYDKSINGSATFNFGDLNYTYQNLTSLIVNNNDSLTGHAPDNNFFGCDIGQGIPPVYEQYRLVSASLVLRYIGRLDIVSGVCGGAIVFNETNMIAGQYIIDGGTSNDSFANNAVSKFGNFDLAMDSFYHQENLSVEGLRMLYFPIDNSFEEYVKLIGSKDLTPVSTGAKDDPIYISVNEDYYKSGFNFMGYVLGAPPSTSCFKLDIYCNFECLPNSEFLNYMPIDTNNVCITNREKKESITIVQKKPVMKMNEDVVNEISKSRNMWEKMKDKFKGSLPGLAKLIKVGVLKAIPQFKAGLALANNLIQMSDQNFEDNDIDMVE